MNSSRNYTLMQLYESPQTVFSIAGTALLLNDARVGVVSKRLNHYVTSGNLLNPRRGIYAKKGYDKEEMACLVYAPSYLSLEYVLQKAGVVFQYDSRYTLVSYLSRSIEIDGHEYCYRKIKGEILADTRGIECRGNINIATPERAFLDIMYLNANYYFDNLRALNYKKITELLPIYSNKRMEERVKKLFNEKK